MLCARSRIGGGVAAIVTGRAQRAVAAGSGTSKHKYAAGRACLRRTCAAYAEAASGTSVAHVGKIRAPHEEKAGSTGEEGSRVAVKYVAR